MWRVVRASDSGRGYAANVSYIDYRISQEIINTIIKPATKSWPYQAFRFYFPHSYDWTGEDEKIDLSKLESFKESILSLIKSNKVLREKGLLKIKTPTKVHYNDGEKLKSELDYGNDEGISLDLIPEENRGKDYSWIDNRVNDSGSPKTLNQTTLDSKKSIKDIDTDLSDNIIPNPESNYTWLNNSSTDDIDFELGDNYLEMKSPVTGLIFEI